MNTISLSIDKKACVGCSLCADVCPTTVFSWSDDNSLPAVDKPSECFGCLSCSEICPATAIHHDDLPLSASYHHDRYTLDLAAKSGKPPHALSIPNDADAIGEAMRDLGVRLLSVASVLKQTLGDSLPSVGTMAGMSLAAQLPRYQPVRNLEMACSHVANTFAPAWELSFSIEGDALSLVVGECYVRDLCYREGIATGGDICVLFYHYLAGYFAKISGKRPRLLASTPGDERCSYSVKLYG